MFQQHCLLSWRKNLIPGDWVNSQSFAVVFEIRVSHLNTEHGIIIIIISSIAIIIIIINILILIMATTSMIDTASCCTTISSPSSPVITGSANL